MKKNHLTYAIFLFIFFGCQKKDLVVESMEKINANGGTQNNAKKLYSILTRIGFKSDQIKDNGKYYVVDGDLLFDKANTDTNYLKKYFLNIRSRNNPVNDRHWVTPNLVSDFNIETMKIATEEFYVPSYNEMHQWKVSARQAMAYWAGIANSSVNFVRRFYEHSFSTSPNTIVIVDDQGALDNFTIAAAEFPTNSFPGFRIRVNLDFNSNVNVPSGQREYNLVHEIGHCLGFRHTNWQIQGEPQLGATAILTTSVSHDPNSVMNGGTANFSWSGFSTDDIIAVQTIYPLGTYYNLVTFPINSKYPSHTTYEVDNFPDPVEITWNASMVSTGTVTIELYKQGTLFNVIGTNIPNTGSFSCALGLYAYQGNEDTVGELQIKVTSNANSSIFDFGQMFSFFVRNNYS